jgi:hypothetical protein
VDDLVRRRGDFGQPTNLQFRRYELLAPLTQGGSAQAKFVQWDKAASPSATYDDTIDGFTIYSFSKATGNAGDRGDCMYFTDRGVWEVIEGPSSSGQAGIAVLLATLFYGTTIGAQAQLYAGTPGSETGSTLITCYEWKLQPGDSIAPNTQIDVASVNGRWYTRNAACKNIYGS